MKRWIVREASTRGQVAKYTITTTVDGPGLGTAGSIEAAGQLGPHIE